MTTAINRIICYLRRSRQDIEREKRTGEDTLATQKKIMLEVLARLSIPYDVVEEIGSGDKIETRPVFQEVLEALREGKYNAVAVKEIPRLGRGTYRDMGQIYDLIVEKRIYIITPYKVFDPANPADARQIRFELFLAREEFELIKERLVGAKYNLAAEGRWMVGTAPYGYRLDPRSGRLVVHEEEAHIVRLIFGLYVNGLEDGHGHKKDVSFRAIAGHLTRMGIPGPRAADWSYLAVKRIIENPVYTGTVRYRTRRRIGNRYYERPRNEWIVVERAHEPIIDPETWEQAQAKLKGAGLPRIKLDSSPGELAGLVVCGKCGRRMVRQCTVQQYERKDGGISRYYKEFLWCTTPECTYVKYRDIEAGILEYLKRLGEFDGQKLQRVFCEMYASRKEAAAAGAEVIVAKKRAELKRRLAFIHEKYEAGIYDDATFLERREEIKRQLAALKDAGAKAGKPGGDREKAPALKENARTFLAAYLEAGDKALKNKLLRQLLARVVVTKTGRGKFDLAIYPRFSPPLV